MKKITAVFLAAFAAYGCGGTASPTATTTANNANVAIVQTANTANSRPPSSDAPIVSSHSTETQKSNAPSSDKPAASTESPMARPIDVAQMTADIEKAESEYKKNPKAKADLARAYFIRATALTGAAQYRAALGDYRKGLKLDPTDEEAKKMHDEILSIFKQIKREPPKEGEEPKPLPMP